MKLTPMRYKGYVWPNNPESYRLRFVRSVAVDKIPFGRYAMQDMGMSYRVMEGEGEFVGEGAYEEFKKLASVFYEGGAGVLVHPVWQTTKAYFVTLEALQEPVEDYVRYRFAFWEEYEGSGAALHEVKPAVAPVTAAKTRRYVTVVSGDTLWAIAAREDMSLQALIALNPQIKNPNLIYPGEQVRVE